MKDKSERERQRRLKEKRRSLKRRRKRETAWEGGDGSPSSSSSMSSSSEENQPSKEDQEDEVSSSSSRSDSRSRYAKRKYDRLFARDKVREQYEELIREQNSKKPEPIYNYYELLDLPDFSEIKAVRKAFRTKSLMYHPDRNPSRVEEAERRFHLISTALDTLKNPERKKSYDGRLLCELKRKARHEPKQPPSPPPPDFDFYNNDPRTNKRKKVKLKPTAAKGSPNSAEETLRQCEKRVRKKRKFRKTNVNAERALNGGKKIGGGAVPVEVFKWTRARKAADLDFLDI